MIEIHNDSKLYYGAPKINYILSTKDNQISIKRIQWLRKETNIKSFNVEKSRSTQRNKRLMSLKKYKETFIWNYFKIVSNINYIHTLKQYPSDDFLPSLKGLILCTF